jgi:hypothetical protein
MTRTRQVASLCLVPPTGSFSAVSYVNSFAIPLFSNMVCRFSGVSWVFMELDKRRRPLTRGAAWLSFLSFGCVRVSEGGCSLPALVAVGIGRSGTAAVAGVLFPRKSNGRLHFIIISRLFESQNS